MALTHKRRKVVDAYMKSFNKKQSMIEAGHSVSMATTRSGDVFGDPAVESKIGLSDQLKALELLVRHLGLSKEKQNIELTGEVALVEQLHAGRKQAGLGDEDG